MENGGNQKVNAIFEARLGGARKPTNVADGPTRERFIRDKYERRKYYDPSALENYVPDEEPTPSSSSRRKVNSRQPSEAARLRAESRRARGGGVETAPKASAPKAAPPPAPPAAAEVDLLDFGAFDSPAPAPAAPPAAPPAPVAPTSPNLDLFANMTVSSNAAPPSPAQTKPVGKTNDDIMAMFSAPQQPMAVAMATPNGGMMMAGTTMPQQQNPMMMQGAQPVMQNNNMMMPGQPAMMPNTNMGQQPNMVMMQGGQPNAANNNMFSMQGSGFGNTMQQNGQNTMFMQQQGNAMLMQQQGNNTLMVQKNNTGNVMVMQQQGGQQQPDSNMMRMMQQASNSDDFGFPQAPMGSGPPIAQNGGQLYNAYSQKQQTAPQQQQNASPNDPFASFGQNVFR